jgi:hypothetical protein
MRRSHCQWSRLIPPARAIAQEECARSVRACPSLVHTSRVPPVLSIICAPFRMTRPASAEGAVGPPSAPWAWIPPSACPRSLGACTGVTDHRRKERQYYGNKEGSAVTINATSRLVDNCRRYPETNRTRLGYKPSVLSDEVHSLTHKPQSQTKGTRAC